MTSFKAMLDATKGIVKMHKINDKDRYLSYLPVAHGMERWLGEVRRCTNILLLFENKTLE
jgi:long-chain acyl-CoA synthetase